MSSAPAARLRRPSAEQRGLHGAGGCRERVGGSAQGGGLAQHRAAEPDDEVGGGQQADAVDRAVGHEHAGQVERQQASPLILVPRHDDERDVAPAGQAAEQPVELGLARRRGFAGRQPHRRRGRPHDAGHVPALDPEPGQRPGVRLRVVEVVLLLEAGVAEELLPVAPTDVRPATGTASGTATSSTRRTLTRLLRPRRSGSRNVICGIASVQAVSTKSLAWLPAATSKRPLEAEPRSCAVLFTRPTARVPRLPPRCCVVSTPPRP